MDFGGFCITDDYAFVILVSLNSTCCKFRTIIPSSDCAMQFNDNMTVIRTKANLFMGTCVFRVEKSE